MTDAHFARARADAASDGGATAGVDAGDDTGAAAGKLADGVIVIVAAVILDDEGRLLLVRKRGTTSYMQAGGKPDAGEAPRDALVRELHEELGVRVTPGSLEHLGRFDAAAANERGFVVDAEVYSVRLESAAVASAEIEEVVWLTRAEASRLPIAPLTSDVLAPLLGAAWR
jgi:8-oxo-dGTP diphosphatase